MMTTCHKASLSTCCEQCHCCQQCNTHQTISAVLCSKGKRMNLSIFINRSTVHTNKCLLVLMLLFSGHLMLYSQDGFRASIRTRRDSIAWTALTFWPNQTNQTSHSSAPVQSSSGVQTLTKCGVHDASLKKCAVQTAISAHPSDSQGRRNQMATNPLNCYYSPLVHLTGNQLNPSCNILIWC